MLIEIFIAYTIPLIVSLFLKDITQSWKWLFLPWVWIFAPLFIVLCRQIDIRTIGIQVCTWKKSLFSLLAVNILVFPLFISAFYVFASIKGLPDIALDLPSSFAGMALFHLLYVSIPEEFFFRGYFQKRIHDMLQKHSGDMKAYVPVLLSALLFSFSHFVLSPGVLALLTFFPALVFGYLRKYTGSLIAPVIFHWECNMLWITLFVSHT